MAQRRAQEIGVGTVCCEAPTKKCHQGGLVPWGSQNWQGNGGPQEVVEAGIEELQVGSGA